MTGLGKPVVPGGRGAAGSILIEVAVAVLLAGVLVGELAAGFSAGMARAAQVDVQASSLAIDGVAAGNDAWNWGPSVSSLSWDVGPVLRVGLRQRDRAAEMVAGLWADGWFLGEHEMDANAGLKVGGAAWEEMQGQELVVRVRDSDGEWGPPWRTVIPDAYGNITREAVAPLPAAGEADLMSGRSTAVHLPSLATAALESSWTGLPQEAAGLGAPAFVVPSTSGLCDIVVTGGVQTWLKEAERVVDLYF